MEPQGRDSGYWYDFSARVVRDGFRRVVAQVERHRDGERIAAGLLLLSAMGGLAVKEADGVLCFCNLATAHTPVCEKVRHALALAEGKVVVS